MTNYTKWTLGFVALLLIVSFVVIWNIQDRFSETKEFSIQDIRDRVELLYSGKVESFEQKEDLFQFTLKRNNSIYNVVVDSNTGNFIEFVKIDSSDSMNIKSDEEIRTLLTTKTKGSIVTISLHMNTPTPQYIVEVTEDDVLKTLVVNAETGEIVSEKVNEQTTSTPNVTAISSEKAKQIALSQLNGSVKYIVFKSSNDGGYYLVEVENTQQTAVFEIHAISGKVLSVTRDLNDDDDDDDDDIEDDFDDDDDDDDE